MRVISAYLLAKLGGNASPGAADIKKICSSVGVEAEDGNIKAFLDAIAGKDVEELISEGMSKIASVPAGGAVAAAPAAGGGGGGAAPAAEAKKEESEEDEDMGFSLFD
ncbi:unnamed protein product [Pedinophyceae sp. YPF-701]|nr:unnamed protein product [Pedinophyceae sp. YPF-701]